MLRFFFRRFSHCHWERARLYYSQTHSGIYTILSHFFCFFYVMYFSHSITPSLVVCILRFVSVYNSLRDDSLNKLAHSHTRIPAHMMVDTLSLLSLIHSLGLLYSYGRSIGRLNCSFVRSFVRWFALTACVYVCWCIFVWRTQWKRQMRIAKQIETRQILMQCSTNINKPAHMVYHKQ